MVSKTAQTCVIRVNKVKKMGRKRKNKLENHGSSRSQEELFGTAKPEDEKAAK
jgi:hypothetical protein